MKATTLSFCNKPVILFFNSIYSQRLLSSTDLKEIFTSFLNTFLKKLITLELQQSLQNIKWKWVNSISNFNNFKTILVINLAYLLRLFVNSDSRLNKNGKMCVFFVAISNRARDIKFSFSVWLENNRLMLFRNLVKIMTDSFVLEIQIFHQLLCLTHKIIT